MGSHSSTNVFQKAGMSGGWGATTGGCCIGGIGIKGPVLVLVLTLTDPILSFSD
jgi:hypothetical protein